MQHGMTRRCKTIEPQVAPRHNFENYNEHALLRLTELNDYGYAGKDL